MRRQSPLVSLVLAGGFGRRLESVTRELSGRPIPKQFCTFGRRRSLLERTLGRVAQLRPVHTAVLVDASQYRRTVRHIAGSPATEIVSQPCDRGTAPGVLIPLLQLLHAAPDAPVFITPSDHGARPAGLDTNDVRSGISVTR